MTRIGIGAGRPLPYGPASLSLSSPPLPLFRSNVNTFMFPLSGVMPTYALYRMRIDVCNTMGHTSSWEMEHWGRTRNYTLRVSASDKQVGKKLIGGGEGGSSNVGDPL